MKAAKFLLKRRTIGTYSNPFKRGGIGKQYGKWVTTASYETMSEAMNAPKSDGLYDWGIFHRGKRVTHWRGYPV